MFQTIRSWWQDRLLRGVLKNSSYLFSSNTASAALSFLQGIFATRLLGVEGLGLVTTVIIFTSNVNRLLSFRMSETMVKYFNQALLEGKKEQAAATTKGIAMLEMVTSCVAYLVLLLLSPWAARVLAKDPQLAALFPLYGLVLLANLCYETSTGVLQAAKRFDRLALVNLLQSLLTATLILAAFISHRGLMAVLMAYLLGKAFAGLAVSVMAFHQLNLLLGRGWWRVPLRAMPAWRNLLSFAANTNLNGTLNLLTRDSAPLFLAALRPAGVAQAEVGYFKLALTVINLVMLPIEPFIWPTYAEITRTIAQKQWETTRRLLRRVSAIAGAWTLAAAGGIAVLGWWLIPFVYGTGTFPAYPTALILLLGYGFANVFNWNRPLLLALSMPAYPLIIAALVGVVEISLTLWLVPAYGYLAMAAVLSAYLIFSISLIMWRGMRELNLRSHAENHPRAADSAS